MYSGALQVLRRIYRQADVPFELSQPLHVVDRSLVPGVVTGNKKYEYMLLRMLLGSGHHLLVVQNPPRLVLQLVVRWYVTVGVVGRHAAGNEAGQFPGKTAVTVVVVEEERRD